MVTFAGLRKSIAIFFLGTLLLTNAELHQLLKIPVLVSHFREHREEDRRISFWSFIKIHYFSKRVIDADYSRDQQLPLKDADSCQLIVKTICECQLPAVEFPAPGTDTRHYSPYREKNKPQVHSFDIFQPPRVQA